MNLNSPARRFVLSVVAALVVGTTTWRSVAKARTESGVGGPAVKIFFIKRPVSAGKTLSSGDVETKYIPTAFAEPGVFHDVKEMTGARSRILLAKGEQLTRSKVETESSRLGLAWSVPAGMTALTLRFPAEGAVGGHVLPGDWVCVLVCPPRAGADVVIGRARVAAVGEKIWDPRGIPGSPATGFGANEFFLVTLILSPNQAESAVSAAERGRLTLALLSPLDAGTGSARREP
jgi:Flp pilus assembly protein CpaB